MMECVQLASATLYHGDCLQAMSDVAFDVIVTDPPYGISHASTFSTRVDDGRFATTQAWAGDVIAGDESTAARDDAIQGVDNVACFGSWKRPPIENCTGCLVWDKGPATGMGDLSFPWKMSHELIFVRGKLWTGRRDEGVLRFLHHPNGQEHPNQKPVALMNYLISKLPESAVICDPFMGVGTTGVAAVSQGRRFVGFEIERRYFDIAVERIDAADRQERLFA